MTLAKIAMIAKEDQKISFSSEF
jgi:hypothetical protein